MTHAVEVRDLRVVRGGRPVVDGLSVDVHAGRVTGLLGPSGCGKSTLMRAIVGVQIVAGGEVTVLGLPAGARALRDQIGYLTQAPSVYGDLTVTENLQYFGAVCGVAAARVRAVIEQVRLTDVANRVVGSLSGGQRSRVSLATALVNEPQVLVLDEPTVGLDPVLRSELWHEFRELAGGGATLLVSSHVMDEAAECDDLLLMRDGAIVVAATPDELRERTGEQDLARAFLAVIREEES